MSCQHACTTEHQFVLNTCIKVFDIPEVALFSSKMHGCLAQHILGASLDFSTLQKLPQSLQVSLLCCNMKWCIEQGVWS